MAWNPGSPAPQLMFFCILEFHTETYVPRVTSLDAESGRDDREGGGAEEPDAPPKTARMVSRKVGWAGERRTLRAPCRAVCGTRVSLQDAACGQGPGAAEYGGQRASPLSPWGPQKLGGFKPFSGPTKERHLPG